jgi:LPS export ABC transporter permease LptG
MLSRFDRWIREDVWYGLRRFSAWRQRRQDQRRAGSKGAPPSTSSPTAAAAGTTPTTSATPATPATTAKLRLRLPQMRWRFPNLIDRYTLRTFAGVMIMVLMSVLTLYIVADLTRRLDDILNQKIPLSMVLTFYRNLSLQVTYDLAPLVLLITTLITFGLLTRSNEVTAAKALGISLYRLSLPAVFAGLLVTAGCIYLQSNILPEANHQMQQLNDRISGRETDRTFRRGHQWLYGRGGFLFNILHYNEAAQSLQRLQVFEIDTENGFAIRRRLYAENAHFEPELGGGQGRWVMSDGWLRSFDGMEKQQGITFPGEALLDSDEKPEFFASELRSPEQMPFGELRRYIHELKASGQAVPDLEVRLYNKFAFPFVSLVMVLVGLPFAFRLGRQGALYGIGLSIVLGMVFFAILALFTSLGKTGVLPPAVAVWSPGVLFTLTSIYLFLGVRT